MVNDVPYLAYLWYCFIQTAITGRSGWCAYRIGCWFWTTAQWWCTRCWWTQRYRIRTISMRWDLYVFEHLQNETKKKKQMNALCGVVISVEIHEYGFYVREFSFFFSIIFAFIRCNSRYSEKAAKNVRYVYIECKWLLLFYSWARESTPDGPAHSYRSTLTHVLPCTLSTKP